MLRIATASLLFLALLVVPVQAQQVVEITASKDNTLYQDPDGNFSNGAGQNLFAGKTSRDELRRALVAFDLVGMIPDGAVVDSVQVQLTMNKSQGSQHHVHLHRVTKDWGEGTSDSGGQEGGGTLAVDGDATWLHAVRPGTTWTNAGGDFVGQESASIPIQSQGSVIWYSTPELVADVNHWLAAPGESFGWLVMGDEVASRSSQRFASRENSDASSRPVLRVFYTVTATFVEDVDQPVQTTLESAWPNPFSSSLSVQIESSSAETILIDVFDIQGRRVLGTQQTLLPGTNLVTLDGAGWATGPYLIKMTGMHAVQTRTVFKTR